MHMIANISILCIEILLRPSPLLMNLYKLYNLYETSGCTGTQSILSYQEAARQSSSVTRDSVAALSLDSARAGTHEMATIGPERTTGSGTLLSTGSGSGSGAVASAVQQTAHTVVSPAAPATPLPSRPSSRARDSDLTFAATAATRRSEEARRQAEESLKRLKLRRFFEVLRDSIIQNLSRYDAFNVRV